MAPFINRNLFIFFLFISFNIVAQTNFKVENSGIVKTKKTDYPEFVLEKDNGGYFILVNDYERNIRYVHEFSEEMKLMKSTKLRELKAHIIAAAIDGDEIKVIGVDYKKSSAQEYIINFKKEKFVEVGDAIVDLDLKKGAYRKMYYEGDIAFNHFAESRYGTDMDMSLYPFSSDNNNYKMFSILHNFTKQGFTVFSSNKPRPSSTRTIVRFDANLKLVDNKKVTLSHSGYDNFYLKHIDYIENEDTYIVYGRSYKKENNEKQKQDRLISELGFETVYVIKGNNKPHRILLQDAEEVIVATTVRIKGEILSTASISMTRVYDEDEDSIVKIIYNQFNLTSFDKLKSLELSIPEYSFVGDNNENILLDSFKIDVFEEMEGKLLIGLNNYDGSGIFNFTNSDGSKTSVTSLRTKGDYHILEFDKSNGNVLSHFQIKREVTTKKKSQRLNNLHFTVSGQWEYWNHGIKSIFYNNKFNFILNAGKIDNTKLSILKYTNAKIKDDKELLKSKPYLITLDLEKGFEYKPLLKTGTSLNGLMVEKMLKISENEYITNTPRPKEKRYVKITLD